MHENNDKSIVMLLIITCTTSFICLENHIPITGLILDLHTANERRRYFVTTSLIGWAQT